jgi:hypothetical protein
MNTVQSLPRWLGVKFVRVVLGTLGFLIIWLAVAAGIGSLMVAVFPPSGGFVANVLNWRNLPGSMLGIIAGAKVFRAIVTALGPGEKTPGMPHKR